MADRKAPATKTALAFGLVNVPVGLLKTTIEPKDAKYDTAGPNGHPLHHETRLFDEEGNEVKPEPVEAAAPEVKPETTQADPGSDAPPPGDPLDAASQAFADAAGLETGPTPKQVLIEAESGVIVPQDEIRRGIRKPDGAFLDLTDGLAEIDEATQLDEMAVVKFIRVEQVPRDRVLGSYYVVAENPRAASALKYLYAGMRETRRVAVVKLTKRKGQTLAVIVPDGKTGAVKLLEVVWANRVRAADSDPRILAHTTKAVTEQGLKATCSLIEAMAGTAAESLDELRDDREMLRGLLRELAEAGRIDEFEVTRRPRATDDKADIVQLVEESSERADEFTEAAQAA